MNFLDDFLTNYDVSYKSKVKELPLKELPPEVIHYLNSDPYWEDQRKEQTEYLQTRLLTYRIIRKQLETDLSSFSISPKLLEAMEKYLG